MFVVLNTIKGGETRQVTCGYFYASKFIIQRFCTPVWRVNAPTALEVLSNGKGRTVLFLPILNFSEMLNAEKKVCTCKACGMPANSNFLQFVNYLFQCKPPEDFKEDLWKIFHLALSSDDFDALIAIDRCELASTYKHLSDLVDNISNLTTKNPKS